MKLIKIGLIITLVLFLSSFFLLIKYQQINNERLTLQDEHCIKINPLIIQRKYDYQAEMSLIAASASAQEVETSLYKYIESNNTYLKQEKVWLNEWSNYINRFDVQLVLGKTRSQVAKLSYKILKADYDSAEIVSSMMNYPNNFQKQSELSKKLESIKGQEEVDLNEYQKILNSRNNRPDIRDFVSYFLKFEPLKCPLQNHNIPNVDPNDIFIPIPNIIPNS